MWDDHDYGPTTPTARTGQALSREAFTLFWGNPSAGIEAARGSPPASTGPTWSSSCSTTAGTVAQHALDRQAPDLRRAQIEWLIDSLASSRATFKSSCRRPGPEHRRAETYANFPEERQDLLRTSKERVAACSSSPATAIHRAARRSGPGLSPLRPTISPLRPGRANGTASEHAARADPRAEQNFGPSSGGLARTRLTLSIFDAKGPEVARTILAAELQLRDEARSLRLGRVLGSGDLDREGKRSMDFDLSPELRASARAARRGSPKKSSFPWSGRSRSREPSPRNREPRLRAPAIAQRLWPMNVPARDGGPGLVGDGAGHRPGRGGAGHQRPLGLRGRPLQRAPRRQRPSSAASTSTRRCAERSRWRPPTR